MSPRPYSAVPDLVVRQAHLEALTGTVPPAALMVSLSNHEGVVPANPITEVFP